MNPDLYSGDDPLSWDSLLQRQRAAIQVQKRDQADRQGAEPDALPMPPLDPAEENTILGNITGKLLGGVSWAGSMLDKYTGGRAVRGLLAGRPRELASIVPFSDQVGLTNDADFTSGRDLTNNIGLTDKADDSWLSTGLGIGADILTNPTSWVDPLGSLTEAGEAAQKIGALAGMTRAQKLAGFASAEAVPALAKAAAVNVGVDVNDLVGKPLMGLMGYHLPFGKTLGVLGAPELTDAGRLANAAGVMPGGIADATRGFAPGSPELAAMGLAKVGPRVEAAKALGATDEQLAGIIGPMVGEQAGRLASQPLRTAGPVADTLFQGADLAGQGLDWLAHTSPLRHVVNPVEKVAAPVGRYVSALFNRDVAGAITPEGQAAGRQYTANVAKGMSDLRTTEGSLIRQAAGTGLLEQPDLVRGIAEAGQGAASPLTDAGRAANDSVDTMRSYLDALDQRAQEMGGGRPQLADDENDYFPRHSTLPPGGIPRGGRGGAALPTDPAALAARDEYLKNIPGSVENGVPGGTLALKRLVQDPDVAAINGRFGPLNGERAGMAPTTPLEREALVRQRYLNVSPKEEQSIPSTLVKASATPQLTSDEEAMWGAAQARTANGEALTPAQQAITDRANQMLADGTMLTPPEKLLLSRWKQSQQLARWAENLPPEMMKTGLFGNHPIEDWMLTATSKLRRNEAMEATHQLFSGAAVPEGLALPGYVPLKDAFASSSFPMPEEAANYLAQRGGWAEKGIQATNLYVPPNIVADATRFNKGFQAPDALKGLIGAVDWFTNLTKTFQTALFPNFHIRNFGSGQFANAMLGAGDPAYSPLNPLHYIAPVMNAQKLLRGQAIEGAADMPYFVGKGLTDAQATAQLADLAYAHRAVETGGALTDAAGSAADRGAALAEKIPGMTPFEGIWKSIKSAVPKTLDEAKPWNVAGVGPNPFAEAAPTADIFAPVAAARKIGDAVDDTNRLSAFIGQMQQGYAPEVAAARARMAHVDYAGLTDFERNVMRRVIPFYSYSRSIIPFVLQQVIDHPGGLGGTSAMAAFEARNQTKDQFVPDYLTSGLALPVGKEADGTQRFLTKFDTPVENAFDKIGNSPQDTALGLLSELNPLIKAPLEQATGKQFFTGRDLADLYPATGNQMLDQVIMNSPASRFATVARQLGDPRKWADPIALATNLGSGVRLSDVDMEKQRQLAAREFVSESLKGEPGVGRYETIYARPGMTGQLSPEQVLLLRLNKTLEAQDKAASKAKGRIGVKD